MRVLNVFVCVCEREGLLCVCVCVCVYVCMCVLLLLLLTKEPDSQCASYWILESDFCVFISVVVTIVHHQNTNDSYLEHAFFKQNTTLHILNRLVCLERVILHGNCCRRSFYMTMVAK